MWKIQWNAISARIIGLIEAGTFFLQTIATGENDHHNMTNELLRNGTETAQAINRFQENYRIQLPGPAQESLDRFASRWEKLPGTSGGLPTLQGALTLLASFRAELDYLLADNEAFGRSLVLRAFAHLQRSLVVDYALRERWQDAFQKGETACEGLGAVHLLLHGIWAFKVSAEGGRSDLVLGTPLEVTDQLQASGEIFVLTEWKKLAAASELNDKERQAFNQATRYSNRSGILGGFELSRQRYLVMVSEDWLKMPNARHENGITYACLNVAVSPSVPSKAR